MIRGMSIGGAMPSNYSSPVTQNRQRPDMTKYRPDAGQNFNDQQYNQWKSSPTGGLAGLQGQTNIQSAAQQGLMQLQSQLGQSDATHGAKLGMQGQEHGAGLQASAEQRRMQMFAPYLDKAMGALTSSSGYGGGAPAKAQHVDFAGISGAEDAARAAAFARAKDQAGEVARSAMSGLNNAMGARGIARSRFSGGGAADIIGRGANQMGEVVREQQIQDYNRAQQRASEHYQGEIAQRGQDVSMRGQDIQTQLARQQALMGLFGSFPGQITARY